MSAWPSARATWPPRGFFPQQPLDNANTDVRTARGRVDTLRSQLGYRSLYAPFAGVVTGRYVDPGALITNAANNQSSSQPVVTVSDPSKLRVSSPPRLQIRSSRSRLVL